MTRSILLMLTMSVIVASANAQLSDCWDPANWTSETQNTTGSVTITASSIELINDTDFGGTNLDSLDCGATDGMVSACITVPATGMLTFDWMVPGGPFFNPLVERFGYCLNGVAVEQTSINPPPFGTTNGTVSIMVTAGDQLCFVYASKFADGFGPVPVTIDNITVPVCPAFLIEMGSSSPLSCWNSANGEVWATVTGNDGPYMYDWDNGQSGLGLDTISGLEAGTYCVTITSNGGDALSACIDLVAPDTLMTSMSSTAATVGGNDGTATVVIAGGTPQYQVEWSTVPVQDSTTAIGLDPGTYYVTVTDANGCSISDSVVVDMATGVVEMANGSGVDLYPNPVRDRLTVVFEIAEGADQLVVNNALGGQVMDQYLGGPVSGTLVLSVADLPTGLYLVTIISNSGRRVTRFVKE